VPLATTEVKMHAFDVLYHESVFEISAATSCAVEHIPQGPEWIISNVLASAANASSKERVCGSYSVATPSPVPHLSMVFPSIALFAAVLCVLVVLDVNLNAQTDEPFNSAAAKSKHGGAKGLAESKVSMNGLQGVTATFSPSLVGITWGDSVWLKWSAIMGNVSLMSLFLT